MFKYKDWIRLNEKKIKERLNETKHKKIIGKLKKIYGDRVITKEDLLGLK